MLQEEPFSLPDSYVAQLGMVLRMHRIYVNPSNSPVVNVAPAWQDAVIINRNPFAAYQKVIKIESGKLSQTHISARHVFRKICQVLVQNLKND